MIHTVYPTWTQRLIKQKSRFVGWMLFTPLCQCFGGNSSCSYSTRFHCGDGILRSISSADFQWLVPKPKSFDLIKPGEDFLTCAESTTCNLANSKWPDFLALKTFSTFPETFSIPVAFMTLVYVHLTHFGTFQWSRNTLTAHRWTPSSFTISYATGGFTVTENEYLCKTFFLFSSLQYNGPF